nr:MAG TPA: hypothetical protein [Caudoviricetes sp.]
MTIQESVETLRSYLRHSEKVHTEPRPFVSPDGTVEFCVINAEADTLYQAVKAVFPLLERVAASEAAPNPAVAMLRCLLSYHERVTMHDSGEYGGLRCYSDALRLGIRCIEKVYGLPESGLDFSSRSTNSDS